MEFGIVIPQGVGAIRRYLPKILEDAENGLPAMFRELLASLGDHLQELSAQADALERENQQ